MRHFLLVIGLLLALTSQAFAAGRLAPSAATVEVARTLAKSGLGPREPIRHAIPGGGERQIYPGQVVSTRSWVAKGTLFTVTRKDNVLSKTQVTEHELIGRKATPVERAAAAAAALPKAP